jgi:hypothetical protein
MSDNSAAYSAYEKSRIENLRRIHGEGDKGINSVTLTITEYEQLKKDAERFNWMMDNYKPMMRFSHLSDEWIIEIPFKHKLLDGVTRTDAFIAEVDKAIQGASNG